MTPGKRFLFGFICLIVALGLLPMATPAYASSKIPRNPYMEKQEVQIPFEDTRAGQQDRQMALAQETAVRVVGNLLAQAYPAGMVSYWKFDEGTGTVASDSVGGNHGTLVNGPVWTAGRVDGALSFDGLDDYVEIPHDASLDLVNDYTIELWIYPKSLTTLNPWLLRKGYWGGGVSVYLLGGELAFSKHTLITISTGYSPPLYEWTHITIVVDSTNGVDFHVNGKLIHTCGDTRNTLTNSESFIIGQRQDDEYFNGLIDEVAIYDRALTEEEIQQHYQNGLNGFGYEIALGPVTEAWVRRYDRAGEGDLARAMAVDSLGNVYVSGCSLGGSTGTDYVTIKYDAAGNQVWLARYDSQPRGTDELWALAVDGLGNVYVTGGSTKGKCNYLTVKYDNSGNELWAACYGTFIAGSAQDIAVDESGNIYVTGMIWRSNRDCCTVKYDSAGNEVWVAWYDGPAGGDDWGKAIALDQSGNVYVIGNSQGIDTGQDYVTIKYDTNGNQLWVACCKSCGASMIGLVAKSGQFFYYVCSNARRKGREMCDTPLLPKGKVEAFVIDRIKQNILTKENLEELIQLTNEELAASCSEDEERLQVLRTQLNNVESRLGKLYDALETGAVRPEQLAPRITALCQRKEELEKAKDEIEEALRQQSLELANPEVIAAYVQDLRKLLSESSIMEQRTFLKSFIQSVEVDGIHLTINYTIPLVAGPYKGELTEAAAVLPIIQSGSPSRTRTYNMPVNSRPLYH